jgi:hypothetical protein
MRPDKPGYWWYKTSDGKERIADIASGFSFELCVIVSLRPVRVLLFECSSEFGEWLGPAYPPKRVDRYIMDTVCDSGGFTNEVEMEKYQTGNWIRYDDVKEYLLDGKEHFETCNYIYENLEQEDNEE